METYPVIRVTTPDGAVSNQPATHPIIQALIGGARAETNLNQLKSGQPVRAQGWLLEPVMEADYAEIREF